MNGLDFVDGHGPASETLREVGRGRALHVLVRYHIHRLDTLFWPDIRRFGHSRKNYRGKGLAPKKIEGKKPTEKIGTRATERPRIP